MNLIKSIRIQFFRSIYDLDLKNLSNITVFAGLNDSGKSNIIKALNLFFNNETDWDSLLDFEYDFSRNRLSRVVETIHGRQFIRIAITFKRGDSFIGSLPEYFDVQRTWYRYSVYPDEKNSLERQLKYGKLPTKNIGSANRSLQRFLNRIHYEYVPAIKDKDYIKYILSRLQDTILENQSREQEFRNAVSSLNKKVQLELKTFIEEYQNVTGIKSIIGLSTNVREVFTSFNINTDLADSSIPIDFRGDGIRMRIIPSLLNYISENSPYQYIWGFEEPENCMENKFASELAQKFENEYSLNYS